VPFPVDWARELGVLDAPTTIRWTDTEDGDAFVFTGSPNNERSGIFVLAGATGLALPPAQQTITDYPALDGGFLQGARSAAREIQIPLLVWGNNRQEYMRLLNALSETMAPDVPRRLVIEDRTFPRRRVRHIVAYYAGGWDGDEGEDASGLTWGKIPLTLTCPDPWFHESGDETFTFSERRLTVVIPELLGGLAWPRFFLSAPFGSYDPEIVNLTTGKSMRLAMTVGAVQAGEPDEEWIIFDENGSLEPDLIEIVSEPRHREVRVNGAVAWDLFDFTSDWFTVRSSDEVMITLNTAPGQTEWNAEMILAPYHRKGI
jgi:Phage tail protein